MKNKNNWCVYMHTNNINGKRYIGISQNPKRRWKNGNGYKTQLFGKAINKYGWDNFTHEILFTGLTENDACEKEIELISLYNTTDDKYGYNILDGGDITSCLLRPNSKRVYQYSLDGDYIGEYESISEATRQVGFGVSECINGRARTAYDFQWFDKYMGEKVEPKLNRCESISLSQSKEVYQYTIDGDFIRKYSSIKEASGINNIERTGIHNCMKGKQLTHKGYRWYSEYLGEKIEPIEQYHNRPRRVYQYSLDGKYINSYPSLRNASKNIGSKIFIGKTNISCGYKWYYEPQNNIKQ